MSARSHCCARLQADAGPKTFGKHSKQKHLQTLNFFEAAHQTQRRDCRPPEKRNAQKQSNVCFGSAVAVCVQRAACRRSRHRGSARVRTRTDCKALRTRVRGAPPRGPCVPLTARVQYSAYTAANVSYAIADRRKRAAASANQVSPDTPHARAHADASGGRSAHRCGSFSTRAISTTPKRVSASARRRSTTSPRHSSAGARARAAQRACGEADARVRLARKTC